MLGTEQRLFVNQFLSIVTISLSVFNKIVFSPRLVQCVVTVFDIAGITVDCRCRLLCLRNQFCIRNSDIEEDKGAKINTGHYDEMQLSVMMTDAGISECLPLPTGRH